jgi:hypothetical protein
LCVRPIKKYIGGIAHEIGRVFLVTMLCLGVLVSPYTLNVSVNANGQDAPRALAFFSDTDASEVIDYVKENPTDNSIVREQALLKKNKMSAKAYALNHASMVRTENPTDIAYPVNYVDKKHLEPTNYHYLREILYYVALDTEKRAQNEATVNNIINMKIASADTIIRDSSDRTTYASAYDVDTLAGRVFTDWQLSQHTNESEREWDYFSLWQGTYLEAYNGYSPTGDALDIKHSLPYSKDDLQDVDPDDTSSSPYSISIQAPWSISLTFNMSSDPNVDQYFDGIDEYATLDIDNMGTNDQFEPQAAWKSGTSSFSVALDINNIADFYKDCFTCGIARAEQDINVRYTTKVHHHQGIKKVNYKTPPSY